MKPDPLTLKNLLKKREMELQNIIRQMKDDNLQKSTVFRRLENELDSVKEKLTNKSESN